MKSTCAYLFEHCRLFYGIVVGLFAAYFVYVVFKHGAEYALSAENLSWFLFNGLWYLLLALLVAVLSAFASHDHR